MVEGSEQCDDGNNDMGDGCSPFCRKEPVCPAAGGACMTACGDGLLLPVDKAAGQQCDDGNTVSGDGCSSTCKIETGYTCTDTPTSQNPLVLPLVLRDFKSFDSTPAAEAHPDFQQFNGQQAGLVASAMGANGKPQRTPVTMTKEATVYDGAGNLQGTDWFAMWYRDTPAYNKTIRQTMTFPRLVTGEYQFNADDTTANPNDGFFPLDHLGWMDDQAVFSPGTPPISNGTHNFYFTSEVRYWFEYKGNEHLDFTGDDDVWVFINKRLAVDLGGIHDATSGTVTLNATNGTGVVCDLVNPCGTSTRTVNFGLTVGSVYEIVVFQAERHTVKSAYRLSLSNFTGTHSTCAIVCGDGVVAGREACDLGTAKNTGDYGTCNADCTLSPRCGDAVVQTPPEQCDDGVNLSTYGGTSKACGPGCLWAPYCGDGHVDATKGEACDQGTDNGKGYGFCTTACQLGPRCGDGVVSNGEECDGTPFCTSACKKMIIP
jgi:fibro-slime domain-containing protein